MPKGIVHSQRGIAHKVKDKRSLKQQLKDARMAHDDAEKDVDNLTLKLKTTQDKVRKLQKELREYKATFDLQQTRLKVATEAWRKATGETEVIPDLGDLLQWLLDKYQLSIDLQSKLDDKQSSDDAYTEVVETEEEDPNLPTKEEFDTREKESKGA